VELAQTLWTVPTSLPSAMMASVANLQTLNSGRFASSFDFGFSWGDGLVEQLAAYIARSQPGLRGFTRANLFRMRHFYETYQGDKKVAPLVRQLPWPHHPLCSNSKRLLAQESYRRLAVERRLIHNKIHKDFRATLLNEPLGSELKLTTATVRIVT
jgi:hypothetical protein